MWGRSIAHEAKRIIFIVTGIVLISRKYARMFNFMRHCVFIQHLQLIIQVLGAI